MTQTISIPGRKINRGDVLYTDWVPRGGDCILLRAELMIKSGSCSVDVTVWTRGEDGTSITQVTATTADISLSTVGVSTAIYLASTSTTPGNGSQEQVRLKIATSGGSVGDYQIVRFFPAIFFDSAKEY